jgi:gamma-glutamylputrescine oxidase
MNLLYANDRPGAYPASWYAAVTPLLTPFPALAGDTRADVAIVGGGYTGLSAALHLAERGQDVVLIDAHRVGWGASGRNGGQLGSGQRQTQDVLERMVGRDHARVLWDLAEDSKAIVRDLVARHGIDCALTPGIAYAGTTPAAARHYAAYAEHLARDYGYAQATALTRADMADFLHAPGYHGGLLDMGAAHLNPLAYALGLARAARDAGVRIHEMTEATRVEAGAVMTARGRIRADHVILACNGYLGGLHGHVAARVMPINNFIVATEPLGTRMDEVLSRPVAVADSNFVVNYFRRDGDRLIFGGGETYGWRFPRDIAGLVRRPLERVFPQLRGVGITHAWGGTLAITMARMPLFARLPGGLLSASGYSGHGVGTATLAGRMLADAVAGEGAAFDAMARVPIPAFPGGTALRHPVLVLAMTWYALRDRLGL